MALDLDLAPLSSQHALGIHQEGAALDTLVFLAVHLFHLDHIKQAAQRIVGVADQLEGKFLLAAKVLMGPQAVA